MLDEVNGHYEVTHPFNNYEISASCLVMYKNRPIIFGGSGDHYKILEVINCGLTKIGNLNFELLTGQCGILERKGNLIF